MNREQMIAWLTIEGWRAHRGGHNFVEPGIFVSEDNAWYAYPTRGKVGVARYKTVRLLSMEQDEMPICDLDDDTLALFYEAISRQMP